MRNSQSKISIIVIGLGRQNSKDYIPALQMSDKFEIAAVHDTNREITAREAKSLEVDVVDDLDAYLTKNSDKIDASLVAVPHSAYLPIIRTLARHKINIIKEKPFATSVDEAKEIVQIVDKSGISLQLTLQRRHHPAFRNFKTLSKAIGEIRSIEGKYVMNIPRLDEGWRASQTMAGGGALADLGYHFVDLMLWYFGMPTEVYCQLSTGNRENQDYDVEDTAFLQFSYNKGSKDHGKTLGHLVLSRVYPGKEEFLTVFGSEGTVTIRNGTIELDMNTSYDAPKIEATNPQDVLLEQLSHCADRILDKTLNGKVDPIYLEHVALSTAAYESAALKTVVDPQEFLKQIQFSYEGA